MSRAALSPRLADRRWLPALAGGVLLTLGLGGLAAASVVDSHVDPVRVTGGCAACHRGHGAPGSPMLPEAQTRVCLRCHGSLGRLAEQVAEGRLAPGVEPPSVASAFNQPFQHPVSDSAFSTDDPGEVVCSSCHSPHRSPLDLGPGRSGLRGERRLSPRNPNRFEYELCGRCHGGVPGNPGPSDVGRLMKPANRSYHPVQAPALDPSPSVRPELQGRFVNCTDCHGNGDAGGARGPHGSPVRSLLRASYTATDGGGESPAAYALCYRCHERQAVLDSPIFPQHRQHVEEERASCSTCHNPHGSVGNRALIRFDEAASPAGVSPSGVTGRLAFVSNGPGSGTCFLTCHGEDHAPESYGGPAALSEPGRLPAGLSAPRHDPFDAPPPPAPRRPSEPLEPPPGNP